MTTEQRALPPYEVDDDGIRISEIIAHLRKRWKLITIGPFLVGAVTAGVTLLIPPTYTARTTLLPPQQQQSTAATALNSLGALAGLAGVTAVKNQADEYVALMQSVTVSDRIIDQYHLQKVYEAKYRVDARKALAQNVHISVGKKDGLITVDVDDRDPERAADIANSYVDGLRYMTNHLAVSEAQQRRVFFEQQLQQAKERLTQAQIALQSSGFSQGALKAEPRAAAEEYGRLKAEVTAAEVTLQTMRGTLASTAPEVLQQQAAVVALREQLNRVEAIDKGGTTGGDSDYVTKYREFKYQETLFDLFARQYEAAKLDESREGGLIQVVDAATPPERKSKPKRTLITLGSLLLAGLVLTAWAILMGQRAATGLGR